MSGVTASRNNGRHRPRGYIENYRPRAETLALLDDVQAVLGEYRDHWPLTARQIFYRLIGAHGYEKTEQFYERLCNHLSNGRRGGVVPFGAIRDDGVSLMPVRHFVDEDHFLSHVRQLGQTYTRNKLAGQAVYIEVWAEAAGMAPQLADVAREYSITVYSCSGFDSMTAKKEIAERICEESRRAVILHLGDLDPSGVSIYQAAAEDVAAFVDHDKPHGYVSMEFRRVALTAEQVELYDLPTAPPKKSDSRSKTWRGETCQLEALPPDAIAELLREEIESLFDFEQLSQDLRDEREERGHITALLLPAPRDDQGGAA